MSSFKLLKSLGMAVRKVASRLLLALRLGTTGWWRRRKSRFTWPSEPPQASYLLSSLPTYYPRKNGSKFWTSQFLLPIRSTLAARMLCRVSLSSFVSAKIRIRVQKTLFKFDVFGISEGLLDFFNWFKSKKNSTSRTCSGPILGRVLGYL